MNRSVCALALAGVALATTAWAQSGGAVTGSLRPAISELRGSSGATPAPGAQGLFLGSVSAEPVQPGPLSLRLSDAIDRALKYNLGVLTLEQQVDSARGARL